MSLLLVIEDKRGPESFRILARKIRNIAIEILVVPQGDMLKVTEVERHIRVRHSFNRNISKILICRDSECTPILQTQRLCQQAEIDLNNRLGRRLPIVKYVVVGHSPEGWLACDENALRKVLGPAVRIRRFNPDDCHPARYMDNLFRKSGRGRYEKSRHIEVLAKASNPENIASRNATFRDFQQAITDP